MRRTSRTFAAVALAALGLAAPLQGTVSAQPAKVPAERATYRTAVDEFDWSTVATSVQAAFGSHLDVGKGIRALLITRLQQAGRLHLVDAAPPPAGSTSAAPPPAEIYLRGDIVSFGRDDRDRRVMLGQFGLAGRLAGGLASKREHRAVVTITYRLIDAAAGVIVAAGDARGESTRTSRGVGGIFARSGGLGGGAIDMSSRNFAETLIGEAVLAAIDRIAADASALAPQLQHVQP
jgi:curli biogenesis system outer membrane secretion channel CsgG